MVVSERPVGPGVESLQPECQSGESIVVSFLRSGVDPVLPAEAHVLPVETAVTAARAVVIQVTVVEAELEETVLRHLGFCGVDILSPVIWTGIMTTIESLCSLPEISLLCLQVWSDHLQDALPGDGDLLRCPGAPRLARDVGGVCGGHRQLHTVTGATAVWACQVQSHTINFTLQSSKSIL